ncbi:hypothetical protein K4749_17535 [Streptomyces sp. TRM72054]|uniref:hypothetical protein n=1 Tax=Streptomyces sp. TRM72054 TaxID=2870562 RepID=UPI001C8C6050|nr:hypothetical protein [Streptomyces sp. TRM72054]MBX9395349.1 hypothetical protein [Streptomyces sp. TRM72054]
MSTHEPWTVSTIGEALGNGELRRQFLAEINSAPVHELSHVAARWQVRVEMLAASAERARKIQTIESEGREIPGDRDVTDKILALAEQARHKGGA